MCNLEQTLTNVHNFCSYIFSKLYNKVEQFDFKLVRRVRWGRRWRRDKIITEIISIKSSIWTYWIKDSQLFMLHSKKWLNCVFINKKTEKVSFFTIFVNGIVFPAIFVLQTLNTYLMIKGNQNLHEDMSK